MNKGQNHVPTNLFFMALTLARVGWQSQVAESGVWGSYSGICSTSSATFHLSQLLLLKDSVACIILPDLHLGMEMGSVGFNGFESALLHFSRYQKEHTF